MFTISLEDRDFAYGYASEEELSTLALDVMQAQEELMTSAIKREVLITVVENIEHGKDLAKAIADKGDASTAMVVAKESLKTNLSFIGQEHLADRIVVGTEDITTATEGIGEMAKKAWNKIKELAKKALDFIMNLFNKVLSFFGKTIKSGKSPVETILMKLQDLKKSGKKVPDDLEIEKEELASILDKNVILIASNGGKFDGAVIGKSMAILTDAINKAMSAYRSINIEEVLVDISNIVAAEKISEKELTGIKEKITKIKIFSSLKKGEVTIHDDGTDISKKIKASELADLSLGDEPGKKAGYALMSGFTASEVMYTVYVFNKFNDMEKFNKLTPSSSMKDICDAFKAVASVTVKKVTINKDNITKLAGIDVKKLKEEKVKVLNVDGAINIASDIVKSLPDLEGTIASMEKSASKSKQISLDFMAQIEKNLNEGSKVAKGGDVDIEAAAEAVKSIGKGVNDYIIKVKESFVTTASKLAQESIRGIPVGLLELTVKHAK